jgi:cofilin
MAAVPVENHLKTGGEQQEFQKRAVASKVDPSCSETFTAFKIRRKHRYIVFRIDLETEAIVVDNAGAKNATVDDFKALLPYTECRYAVYDREYKTHDGRLTNKLFFLTWMPHSATPHTKMAYVSGKGMLRDQLDGLIDTACSVVDGIEAALGMVEEKAEAEDHGDPTDW